METNLIINHNGKPCTTSRLIAQKFGKRHSDVLRAIQNLECSQEFNERNFAFIDNQEVTHSPAVQDKFYFVSKDGFTLLAMGFTGKAAMKFKEEYIARFNEMEQQLKNPLGIQLPNFSNPAEAARAWAQAYEEKQQLEAQRRIDAPKAEYYDEVLQSENTYNVTEIAKELEMTAKQLNDILKDKGVQYQTGSRWVLDKKYQNNGLTRTKTDVSKPDGEGKTFTVTQMVWTEKGRRFIHELIRGTSNQGLFLKNESYVSNIR